MSKRDTRKLLNKFRVSRSDVDLNLYLQSKHTFRGLCKSKRLAFSKKDIDDLEEYINSPRLFWNEIKKATSKPRVTPNISLYEWYNHFSNLFAAAGDTDIENGNPVNDVHVDIEELGDIEEFIFNSDISPSEVLDRVKSLKLKKSSGGNIASHIVYGINVLLFIVKLFNRVFKSGKPLEQWTQTIVVPIHKKGSAISPNYRGIALIEVLSKVYITILTKRLTLSQSGFRSGYSTVDNAFILYSLINKYLYVRKKSLYVVFIDFQKAFDSVDRQLLYNILRQNGVKGKLFSAIKSIYVCVKTRVRTTYGMSDNFNCLIGLIQGCSLSPIIFALFINELYDVLHNSNTRCPTFPDIVEKNMLMFADDIALLSDTVAGLQRQLNILYDYCLTSKLYVNIAKKKVLVFKRGG